MMDPYQQLDSNVRLSIEHLGDNNAFEDVTEREQAKIVAAQLTNQRDRFFKLHAKTLTKGE